VQEIDEQHSDDPSFKFDAVTLADLREAKERYFSKKIIPLMTSEEKIEREVVDSED